MKLNSFMRFGLLSVCCFMLMSCGKQIAEINAENKAAMAKNYYETGEKYFLNKEFTQAFEQFEKAAQYGSAIAQNDLGGMYAKGIGTIKNDEKAYFWIQKSALQNFPEAQYNLALIYDQGALCG